MSAVISGVGEAPPVRRSGQSAEQLTLVAIDAALAEAGVGPVDIDGVVTESSLTPWMAPLDRIAPAMGLVNISCVRQSSPVGAGILGAIGIAFDLVETGRAKHVLTYFAVNWGTSSSGPLEYHAQMEAKRIVEEPAGFAGPPLYFAVAAQRYAHVYGLSPDELELLLADVTMAARANALAHPAAQLRRGLDLDGYRASPFIAEPLRAADCSLLSDGAMAMVISRQDLMRPGADQVGLAGWGYATDPIPDGDFYTQSRSLPLLPAASRAAERAFREAGLTPHEIGVYELYDCFSIATALQLEALGRCAPGGARDLAANGGLRVTGSTPTNTHGGLLAHGYILGANHAVEAVRQLRWRAGERQVPKVTTAFVGAGPGRQYTALILKRLVP